MRDEAVIAGIAHGGMEKPVDHQRAGLLVHLVFDRLPADRDFDDDIDLARRILPDRDGVNAHGRLRLALRLGLGSNASREPAAVRARTEPVRWPGGLSWSRRRRPCRATWARI